jgi:hypothetical protein
LRTYNGFRSNRGSLGITIAIPEEISLTAHELSALSVIHQRKTIKQFNVSTCSDIVCLVSNQA